MSSIAHAHCSTDGETKLRAEELRAAIADLPVESQQGVITELARAAAEYEQHGHVDPLLHFVTGLLMTARLHRNPRYLKALAETDSQAPGDAVDITAWLNERGVTRSAR